LYISATGHEIAHKADESKSYVNAAIGDCPWNPVKVMITCVVMVTVPPSSGGVAQDDDAENHVDDREDC